MGQEYLLKRGYLREKNNSYLLAGKKEIFFEMLAIKDLEEWKKYSSPVHGRSQ